jgi:hypothetical protein
MTRHHLDDDVAPNIYEELMTRDEKNQLILISPAMEEGAIIFPSASLQG